jgi:hypothetical protein
VLIVEETRVRSIQGAVDAGRGVSLNLDLGAEFDDLSGRHAEKGG